MKEKVRSHFNGNFEIFYGKYLKQIKKISGDEFKAICPFHNDTNPSLNFNNVNGTYYCHGCNKKGDFIHFYAKVNNLDTRNDFGKILKGIANDHGIPWTDNQKKKVIARYVYTDERGKPLHRTCRTEPKSFYQQKHTGKSWVSGLKGIEPVLYRLPQILKANEVVIVEGEQDADNISKLGLCGTTCAMGAKKWRDEYSEALKGKAVIILPDNDDEGREHAQKVAESLDGRAAAIKIVDLPGLAAKGDVSDFIQTFNGDSEAAAERLAILIDQAQTYDPPKIYTIDDIIIPVDEFCSLEIAERECFLFPWLKEDSISLISGWRGSGKTWFALGILNAVTKGESFGSWECEKSAACLFLDGEMTVQDDMERFKGLGLHTERPSPLYIYSDAWANRCGVARAHLANEAWRSMMQQILLSRNIRLFVIDNLASLASGLDENSKLDWDPINSWLLDLRFKGVSTIMLHHVNKDGGQRGTSAREDNLDISIMLKKPQGYVTEDGARFIVHFTKQRVRMRDLWTLVDTEFKLLENDNQYTWLCDTVKAQNKKEVLRMIDEGYENKDITEMLKISKGYVSKIRTKLINDGFLTKNGSLTPSGHSLIDG